MAKVDLFKVTVDISKDINLARLARWRIQQPGKVLPRRLILREPCWNKKIFSLTIDFAAQ